MKLEKIWWSSILSERFARYETWKHSRQIKLFRLRPSRRRDSLIIYGGRESDEEQKMRQIEVRSEDLSALWKREKIECPTKYSTSYGLIKLKRRNSEWNLKRLLIAIQRDWRFPKVIVEFKIHTTKRMPLLTGEHWRIVFEFSRNSLNLTNAFAVRSARGYRITQLVESC